MAVNATNAFWEIVNNVIYKDQDDLSKTEAYSFFKECVEKNTLIFIEIDNYILEYNNVTDLFYKTLSFYRSIKPTALERIVLEKAILRIENIIEVDDVTDELCMKMNM